MLVRSRDQQQSVAGQHPPELINHRTRVAHVFDRLEGDDQVERPVLEGELPDVAAHELGTGMSHRRVGDRTLVEIDAHSRSRARGGQERGSVALAAGGVEHTAIRSQLGGHQIADEVLGVHHFPVLDIGQEALASRP